MKLCLSVKNVHNQLFGETVGLELLKNFEYLIQYCNGQNNVWA